MINQLRTEALSGQIDDLAHVISVDCMADCLTKASAKADYLLKAINTGVLPNVDKHPPFRELVKGKHQAYETQSLAQWITYNINHAGDVFTFLGLPVQREVQICLASANWSDF